MEKISGRDNINKFSRGYHSIANWEYYLEAWHGRSRLKKARELLKSESISRILDVGCGNGFFLRTIETGADKYGVDIINMEKYEEEIYIQTDIEDGLPFKNEVFDALFAGEIIEHLLGTDNFLRECFRVLRHNGFIVLTTPNLCSLKNLFLMLLGKQPVAVDFSLEEGVGHLRAFSPEALQKILKKSGFTLQNLCTDRLPIPFAPPKSSLFLRIEQILGDIFRRWGNILIVKARKY